MSILGGKDLFYFLNAERSKVLPIPPPAAPLLNPTAGAVYPIFTSSPVRTSLKKPIFKAKPPSNSSLPLERSGFEEEERQEITSSSKDNEAGLIKPEVLDTFREVEEKTEAGAAFLDCEDEPPGATGAGEEDEDETIFFTPELFEDTNDAGGPDAETTTGPRGPAACSDELSETVEGGREKKPQGEREGVRGQKEGVEGGQVENQSRKTRGWPHRASRSRQKVPSSPTGN